MYTFFCQPQYIYMMNEWMNEWFEIYNVSMWASDFPVIGNSETLNECTSHILKKQPLESLIWFDSIVTSPRVLLFQNELKQNIWIVLKFWKGLIILHLKLHILCQTYLFSSSHPMWGQQRIRRRYKVHFVCCVCLCV